MKCDNCGFENKDSAKFCTKCGQSLAVKPSTPKSGSNNSKFIIIGLVAVIIILIAAIGFFALNNGSSDASGNNAQSDAASDAVKSNLEDSKASSESSDSDSSSQSTQSVQTSKSKSWESIGKYSGSGSGSETIEVPAGNIMVKLSAYPIKNYATNHLYVSGSNGQSGGVDWGSKSAVATRSDSFTYESSSSEVFTIDYYETVSWEVEFFRYQ